MARTIPLALASHLALPVTTTCHCLKIIGRSGKVLAVTDLDVDVDFNDGTGLRTYSAAVGLIPSALIDRLDGSVDSAEAQGLLPEFELDITQAEVEAGEFSDAEFAVYLVNYEDPYHDPALIRTGRTGQMRHEDGLTWFGELRNMLDELLQSVVQRDSRTCRAIFGSQPAGSLIPGPVERFPCKVDAEALYLPFTVASAGAEPDRIFVDPALTQANGHFNRGKVRWRTGPNAGREVEVEVSYATGEIRLRFPTRYNIGAGDEGDIRIGCAKRYLEDCIGKFSNGPNFRGEPYIPTGDSDELTVPGAGARAGEGGYSSQRPGVNDQLEEA